MELARDSSIKKLAMAFIALNILDCAITAYFVSNGTGFEINPLLRVLLQTPGLFWLFKVSEGALLAYILLRLNQVSALKLLVVFMAGICVLGLVVMAIAQ